MRLDIYLSDNKYYSSRQKAKYAIEEGLVKINNKIITKPSFDVSENDNITLINKDENYVSRAGYKLSKAIKYFNIDVNNKICLDIGASTGGFSDCLIQNNAKIVYAVDVGSDQLDKSLRLNNKIKSIENLNFRNASKEDLDNTMFDIVSIDVSFISLDYIFSNLINFINNKSLVIALIKPQFELYKEANKYKGIIKNKLDHIKAINKVINDANKYNLNLINLTYSPILGEKKGNIEYLGLFKLDKEKSDINIEKIVLESHKNLY